MRSLLRIAIRGLRLADRALEILVFDVLFARRFRTAVLGGAAAAGAVLFVLWGGAGPAPALDEQDSEALHRLLLNRPWLDHMPQGEHDPYKALVFQKRGYGAAIRATAYRGRWELYMFREREGKRLDFFFPHDKRRASTGFSISETRHGNFDLELTLEEPPLGPKTYYSWKKKRHDEPGSGALRSVALEHWLLPAGGEETDEAAPLDWPEE